MTYNLANIKRIYTAPESVIQPTESSLKLLTNGSLVLPGITIIGSTLAVICDLGTRVQLSQIVYTRLRALTEVVSVYGKIDDHSSFSWDLLAGNNNLSNFIVNLTAASQKYRFIKIVHTVSVGTGRAHEIEIFADTSEVGLGLFGNESLTSVDSGTGSLFIEELKVFNKDNQQKRFYAVVDSLSGNSTDLTLSSSISGPFHGLYSNSISLPETFNWGSGYFSNTIEDGSTVILVSGTTGSYYSPVLNISYLESPRLFWTTTVTGTNKIDSSSLIDSVDTIYVRYSNTSPTDIGWESGDLSEDSLWSVSSGTLEYVPFSNHQVLPYPLPLYVQFKLDFISSSDGESPILTRVGLEQPTMIDVDTNTYANLYLRSNTMENKANSSTAILIWSYEFEHGEQN